jgi:hypothetical protein
MFSGGFRDLDAVMAAKRVGPARITAIRVLPYQFVCFLNRSSDSNNIMGDIYNDHGDVAA